MPKADLKSKNAIERKQGYREGDIFAIPVEDWGVAVGLVAQKPKRGHLILVYIFNKRFDSVYDIDMLVVDPRNVCLKGMMGDLFILNARWKVIGSIGAIDRKVWPLPKLLKWRIGFTEPKRWFIADLAEDNCNKETNCYEVGVLPDNLIASAVYGPGDIDWRLKELIAF
jgi:hypothetical protein